MNTDCLRVPRSLNFYFAVYFQFSEQLIQLTEAFSEVRDLAVAIGVTFEPTSDLQGASAPPELLSPSQEAYRVKKLVSLETEHLVGQIAEGQALLEALDRRFPAITALTTMVDERLATTVISGQQNDSTSHIVDTHGKI